MSEYYNRIASLIVKDLQGLITIEETIELNSWINESAENRLLYDELKSDQQRISELEEFAAGRNLVWQKLQENIIADKVIPVHRHRSWKLIAAAVLFIGLLSAGALFIIRSRTSKSAIPTDAVAITPTSNDVMPGSNKAILTLKDGSILELDNAKTGNLVNESGFTIVKLNDGQLQYKRAVENTNPGNPVHEDLPYNTLTTPRGGQYKLVLGDGTKVWLNAASSISYPIAFNAKERKVTITGEVYFEVEPQFSNTTNKKVPFIVKVMNSSGKEVSEIEVLGTHFNVNGYEDESAVRTTLLEGSVQVQSTGSGRSVIIQPGQQAIVMPDNKLQTANDINADEIMAWKNGQFMFKSVDIETIMRQAARWYDLKVVYDEEKPKDKFTGKISRNVNLSQLLKILEYSEVHFTLREGRTLFISRND
jgi:transmembrane sensor